jgi:hypothetical protein
MSFLTVVHFSYRFTLYSVQTLKDEKEERVISLVRDIHELLGDVVAKQSQHRIDALAVALALVGLAGISNDMIANFYSAEGDVRCALFDRNLHSRSAIDYHAFAPPLEALSCVCYQWPSSRVSTVLPFVGCQLCPNTEGTHPSQADIPTMNSATALMTSHNTEGKHPSQADIPTRHCACFVGSRGLLVG